MTKRYIHNLKPYYHFDKQEDEEYYGYEKNGVEESYDDISNTIDLAEHYLLKGEIGSCLDILSNLREKL